MSTTQPIKSVKQLEQFKKYYQEVSPDSRNYALIILGLNTALRISDILRLHIADGISGSIVLTGTLKLRRRKPGKILPYI